MHSKECFPINKHSWKSYILHIYEQRHWGLHEEHTPSRHRIDQCHILLQVIQQYWCDAKWTYVFPSSVHHKFYKRICNCSSPAKLQCISVCQTSITWLLTRKPRCCKETERCSIFLPRPTTNDSSLVIYIPWNTELYHILSYHCNAYKKAQLSLTNPRDVV